MSKNRSKDIAVVEHSLNVPRVVRSDVPAGKDYNDYRPILRHDFYYTCAYCLISEAEATATRFTIDHYEARKHRPDLAHEYSNLMYCCDRCNLLKGARYPTEAERAAGRKFYRIDTDIYSDHFSIKGDLLQNKSETGFYTIQACDLNRPALQRLRQLRRRLNSCDALVSEGLFSLKHMHIDQLPPFLRGKAATQISQLAGMVDQIAEEIDEILRENMRSHLADEDPEFEKRAKERASAMRSVSLNPGVWHERKLSDVKK